MNTIWWSTGALGAAAAIMQPMLWETLDSRAAGNRARARHDLKTVVERELHSHGDQPARPQ